MKVIPSLKYCKGHTWVKVEDDYAYIGITVMHKINWEKYYLLRCLK